VPLQQLGVAAWGVWWYRRRFGRTFHALVRELESHDRWTVEQFGVLRRERLASVLAAAARAPYWRETFAKAGLDLRGDAEASLGALPLLSKETLRVRARDLLTQDPPPRGTLVFRSSGTSGTPTEIYFTRAFHALELAVPEARTFHWAGVTYRDRRVMFGARKICRPDQRRPPYWRYSPAEDLAYASVYHLSPANFPAYVSFLRRFRPAIVMGYPSALATLAAWALETGDLPAAARVVVTTSETVTSAARDAIEAAFRCRLFDRYGAVEQCAFASQCAEGRYHVSPEVGIVEILDPEGRPCPPGTVGEVVCTGLANTLQPLLRYRVGDAASWAVEQACPCGRQMPILEGIEGRYEDMCVTPDGRRVLRFDTVFKGVSAIREAQVVQERRDFFVLNVVAAEGFSEKDAQTLRENMRLHVGEVVTEVHLVPSIPRTPAGKFRAVICRVPGGSRT
jgi:phenylacetate-CoA ligase